MNRIEKVQKLIKQMDLDALIVDHPIDLYYLTNQELSLGRLVVSTEEAILFVDGRYFEACKNNDLVPVKLTAGYEEQSAFRKWWPFSQKNVGFDAAATPYATYQTLSGLNARLHPLNSPIKGIRELKDSEEIDRLKHAAELDSKGFDFVCSLLKEGVTEQELARALQIFWLEHGSESLSFTPHIAFGEGSSQPHYHISRRALKKNEPVLVDIGVMLDHYHSDMTRTVYFGQMNQKIETIYDIVKRAYEAALKLCCPGSLIKDVDLAARNLIADEGYGEYFPHSLGHGVGLEVHESPVIRSTGKDANRELQEGMVITIEPGIYLPEIGGVRLEDTLVITKQGYQNLTNRPL